jgi:hypothetical protein
MNKEQAIQQLAQAVKETEETYNRVSNGDITFSEAGDMFHSFLADEQLTAMKKALEVLRDDVI